MICMTFFFFLHFYLNFSVFCFFTLASHGWRKSTVQVNSVCVVTYSVPSSSRKSMFDRQLRILNHAAPPSLFVCCEQIV